MSNTMPNSASTPESKPNEMTTAAPAPTTEAMPLGNYALFKLSGDTDNVLTDICGMVLPSDLTPEALKNGAYVALGTVNNHPRIDPGTTVFTSLIKMCDNNQLSTKSGSLYTLLDMHPDYMEFAEAAKQYPVLENWGIGNATISEDPSVPVGVFIKGDVRGTKEAITKLITAQEGSVITCHDGEKYCIDWCAANCFQNFMLQGLASPKETQHDKVTPILILSAYDPEQECTLSHTISWRVNFLEINWETHAAEWHIHLSKAKNLWNLEG